MTSTTDIYVKSGSFGYQTNRVRGNSGNSTCSAAVAAMTLAKKLFGPSLVDVQKELDENIYTTRWRITHDDEAFASISRDGEIEFAYMIPPMNTSVARGPLRALQLVVNNQVVMRRPALLGLVSSEEWDAALLAWLHSCAGATPRKTGFGVTFDTTIRRVAW